MKAGINTWLKAARLKFHILGIMPVLIGALIAFYNTEKFSLTGLVFCELVTMLVLIASIFFNDYSDVHRDTVNKNIDIFSRGTRPLIRGLISKKEMLNAAIMVSLASLSLSAIFVVFFEGHPSIILFNIIGLFAGIQYSHHPLKMGHRGLGEFLITAMYSFFCIFFGYVGQVGWLFDLTIIYFSIPVGIAIFLIIITAEIPDHDSDKAAGKLTIPTMFGLEASLTIYFIGLVLLYMSIFILYLAGLMTKFTLSWIFLSIPLGVYAGAHSTAKHRTLPKHALNICTATFILYVWINLVFSLSLAFAF
jgi:1,4-dihydroxy-2-naphthoate polyprenyltransferase